MRAIAEPFFERSPYLLGPVFTLVLFFVVFLGIVVWVMRSKTMKFDNVSSLPLSDDTHPISPPAVTAKSQGTLTASEAG
ncbi:MAG: cbb3-type cytochrome c oxidase subunit 3 [Sandaracinaceae bacterium]|nr:cbb3-type cytochrome c oxidase subunit 3 [Sandaracinaceae bacterium]